MMSVNWRKPTLVDQFTSIYPPVETGGYLFLTRKVLLYNKNTLPKRPQPHALTAPQTQSRMRSCTILTVFHKFSPSPPPLTASSLSSSHPRVRSSSSSPPFPVLSMRPCSAGARGCDRQASAAAGAFCRRNLHHGMLSLARARSQPRAGSPAFPCNQITVDVCVRLVSRTMTSVGTSFRGQMMDGMSIPVATKSRRSARRQVSGV